MRLGFTEQIGVDHVDLERRPAIFDVPTKEGLELVLVFGVADQRRAEGHGVASAIGQGVVEAVPVSVAIRGLATEDLAHRVHVGCGPVSVGAVGGAQGIGQKLAVGTPIRAGGKDKAVGDPIVPAQHAGAELAAGVAALMLPGLCSPEVHHLAGHLVGLIVIAPVLGCPIKRLCLQCLVTFPVVLKGCDQLCHGAPLLFEDQVLDGKERVYGGGVGDGLDGAIEQLRSTLGDIQTFLGAAAHQTGEIGGGGETGHHFFSLFKEAHDPVDDEAGLLGVGRPKLVPGLKRSGVTRVRSPAPAFVSLAGHGVGEGDQVVPAGQGQLDGFEQIEIEIDSAGAVVSHHGVLKAAHGRVVVDVGFVDEVLDAGYTGLAHHSSHGALVKVQEEGRALAG